MVSGISDPLICRHIDCLQVVSEAAGLSKGDIYLDEEVPYVDIKPHPWRRLKTAGSQRKVPLVGMSIWAAKQACTASNSAFLFPRYCDETECHSNSASAALNKWLKQVAGPDYVIHSDILCVIGFVQLIAHQI